MENKKTFSQKFVEFNEAILSPSQFQKGDILKVKKQRDEEKNQLVRNRLQTLFKIDFKNKGNKPSDKIITFVNKGEDKKGITHLDRENFPEEIKQLFDYWSNDCHDTAKSWEQRKQLYEDMDMIYYNSPLIARAIELIADEVIQADSNQQPIFIEAKPKVKKFILDFFDRVGLYDLIRSTIIDIIQYGNAGWILALENNGVNEIIPINVYDLKERFQFTPFEVAQKLHGKDEFFQRLRGMDRMNQLIDSLVSKEDEITRFKSYLLGFQIGEYAVPPWRFLHFRNATNKSPFKPFGVPVFIHSIAPYRQYDAAMTLQVLARGAKFPRDVFNLNIPNIVDPTEKMAFATEFINQYQNSGLGSTKKEDMGVGERIVTIKDLYEYSQETPQIDLGRIDDIQMLRDDLTVSTQLPRSLLDSNDAGFGATGVALLQQSKPFARLVFRIQNIFLQNVSQLVKIHMIQSNKFTLEEMDFVLSMPYPESQTNSDIITSQSSLLTLANDIIAAIEDKILGGEKVPPELIQKIYHKILPYDDNTINSWFTSIKGKEKDGEEIPKEKLVSNAKLYEGFALIEAATGKKRLYEQVEQLIFNKRQEHLKEGVMENKHFYSSKNIYSDFPAETLRTLDKQRLAKLKEKKETKEYFKEEVEYVYESKADSKNETDSTKTLEEEVEDLEQEILNNSDTIETIKEE